jgi:hypothetical protein
MKEQKNTLYNITKYLLSCYQQGTEPVKELMEKVDFSEISSLNVFYLDSEKHLIQYEIKESLAKNCLNYIPFEAYEKYITADWLNYSENQDGIISSAIYRQNTKFIDKLNKLGFEKAQVDNDYCHSYLRNFIAQILKVERTFGVDSRKEWNTDFLKSYHDVLQKVSDEHKFLLNFHYYLGEKKTPYKKSRKNNWVESASRENYTSNGSYDNTIISVLASNNQFKDMLADAISQVIISSKKKEKLIEILGVNDKTGKDFYENSLVVAIKSNSFECVGLIIEAAGLNMEEVRDNYDSIIEKHIDSCKNIYFKSLFSEASGDFYLNIQKKYFPDLESRYSQVFVFSKNKELKEKIEKTKVNYLTSFLKIEDKNNTNIGEILKLTKVFNDFISQWKDMGKIIELPDNSYDVRNVPIEFGFAKYLVEERKDIVDNISLTNIYDVEWQKLKKLIKDVPVLFKIVEKNGGLKKNIVVSQQEIETWFDAYKLNILLVDNGVEQKSKKIKI